MCYRKRLCRIVFIDEMNFSFMPERGTIDAVFILGRMQEEHHSKRKSCICFVDLQMAYDRVLRKVLKWAMMKKGILETNTRVRVDSELSEEFEDRVEMHQRSVLSSFLFAMMMDVVR